MDARTLRLIRSTAAGYLDDTCAIERPIDKQDAYGAPDLEWVTIAIGVACRLIKPGNRTSSESGEIAEQELLANAYSLAIAHDADIEADDRLIISGKYYDVLRLEDRLSDAVFKMAVIQRR